MAKKKSATGSLDPRFAELIDDLAADPKFASVIEDFEASQNAGKKKFGSNALKINGKIFAMAVKGHLVVKLPKDRVDEMVASSEGERFDPGHGRKMKEWLTVLNDELSWIDLVKEAHDFVEAASG